MLITKQSMILTTIMSILMTSTTGIAEIAVAGNMFPLAIAIERLKSRFVSCSMIFGLYSFKKRANDDAMGKPNGVLLGQDSQGASPLLSIDDA